MGLSFALQRLVDALDMSDATAEHVARALRDKNYLRRARRNDGDEWPAEQLANLILAGSSFHAVRAVEAVEGFAECEFLTSPGTPAEEQAPRLGAGNIRDVLTRMIEASAAISERPMQERLNSYNPTKTFPSHFNFMTPPRRVEFVWIAPSGAIERVEIYTPPRRDLFGAKGGPASWMDSGVIARSANIPAAVIQTAGQIWRDSLSHRNLTHEAAK